MLPLGFYVILIGQSFPRLNRKIKSNMLVYQVLCFRYFGCFDVLGGS